MNTAENKVVLITGAAQRIGAAIARYLHSQGMNLALHYHTAKEAAHALQNELNDIRKDSVILLQSNLLHINKIRSVVRTAADAWGRLDVLINNASTFYPTPMGQINETQWDDLIGTNVKAPLFLSQEAAPYLTERNGCIINITDIHAERPLKAHPVYSVAKAGLASLTQALARELGPNVRVNAISPGAILWPSQGLDEVTQKRIISRIALKRQGKPEDIAKTVLFLINEADYMTGQIISIDGGRTLTN